MIINLKTDIFSSPAQTLVNTVNTVGVMGKGIAKSFKEKYPQMFQSYKKICDEKKLDIGKLHIWRGPEKWVLNFPTKTTWKKPSQLNFIMAGLEKFCQIFEEMGITSISFPPLGCGNGQLDWSVIKPIMESYLGKLPIQIFIHEVTVAADFIPEHEERRPQNFNIPSSFDNFLSDLKKIIHQEKCSFSTLTNTSGFTASMTTDGLVIKRDHRSPELIPNSAMLMAWSTLQAGVLSNDQFNDNSSRRYKSYLFPVLATLPYVMVTKTSNSIDDSEKVGLLLREYKTDSGPEQKDLWRSH